jgi:predicted MFS family arabinose efflux permease
MTEAAGSSAEGLEPEARSTFRGVVHSPQFRWLWLAGAQSLLGDQLARVALTILVYDRTRSELATAAAYALTFLPALVGNVALGPVVDRLRPRLVLVCGDLVRAGLLASMALPHVPIAVLMILLTVAVFVGAPWQSVETALVAELVPERDLALGLGLRTATLQAAQLVGFAVGGVVVGLFGPRTALAIDAATFLISAIVIRIGVQERAAAPGNAEAPGTTGSTRWFAAVGAVLHDRRTRTLLGFSWLLGLLVIPEGLAAPFAHTLHLGPAAVGLLLAAAPTGVLVGSLLFSRLTRPATRVRLVGPLAMVSGLPLVASAFTHHLIVALGLWALSGAATAYHVQVITEYVQSVPQTRRVQAIGFASAGLLAAQGVGLLVGGALAQWTGPAGAIATGGACASIAAAFLALARRRA